MTRSLFSTSFLLVALGSTAVGCGDGDTGNGGGGNGGTGASTNTNGGGGAGGSTTTSTTDGGGGSGGNTTSTTDGGGGSGGATTTSTSTTTTSTTSTSTPTPVEDEDNDGWSAADGDCCDSVFAGCSDKPELVNPGALEYPGNGVDDDCNPVTLDTDPYPKCSNTAMAEADLNAAQPAVSSTKLVRAMDLCVFTSEDPPELKDRTWGVISSQITLADGTIAVQPKNIQLGVLPSFGPNVLPQYGETMAAISSGTARREGDLNYVHPQKGPGANQPGSYNAQTQCPAPPAYVAANGGVLPNPCADCTGANCNTAYDSVALRVRIRPPTNAKSFSYRFNFFSAEYPEYVCEDFNDFFVALLNGNTHPDIPDDKNIAFDSQLNPVSVNNAFFQVCFPQVGAPPGSCSGGTLELLGNGMGGWDGAINDGGATGWLQNDVPLLLKPNVNNANPPLNCDPPADPNTPPPDCVPVVETFDLQFTIWDQGDHNVDSLILLDRFRWNLDPATLLTHQ